LPAGLSWRRQDRSGAIARFENLKRRAGSTTKPPALNALTLSIADRGIAIRRRCDIRASRCRRISMPTAREWQARAALWSGDWKLAADSIANMSSTNRQTTRWR